MSEFKIRMVRGDACTPQRFWDVVWVIPEDIAKYEAVGYVISFNQTI